MTEPGAVRRPWARPAPWAILSGAALSVALVLPSSASDWLFWGAVAASCAAAAVHVVLAAE